MKHLTRSLLLLLPALCGLAQDSLMERLNQDMLIEQQRTVRDTGKIDPTLDPKRIINESANFLKEREPEMTAEEYALYERVVTMLNTRPEFALKLLEAMTGDKEPPSPAFEFILGNAYYAAGNNEKSEASYRSVVKRYPTFLRAWANLGVIYYTTGRYAQAITCFARCVSLGDREPTTFGLMGYSLEQEKRIVQAEMAYMQALSGDPANGDWLEGLLRIYVQGKQYGRAEWLVKDLIRQKPREIRYWSVYANMLLAQNRKLEAIALLEITAGTKIAGAAELSQLADLYADQKLVPEAIATYQRVRRETPDLGEKKLLTLADMLIYSRNLPLAQQVLDSLGGQLTPAGRIAVLQARADLLAAKNKWPEARRQLDEVLQLDPLNGRALLGLGRVYVAEENLPRAQLAFEAAYQIPDSLYRACLELATLELKNRHFAKTVEYLEKALSIEKTVPVQDFLARVRALLDAGPDNT
jgi:tetratricopeptide (TPR) repeat protein